MTISRKLFWHTAITIGLLTVLLAIVSPPGHVAYAEGGDLCQFNGPVTVVPGERNMYTIRVEDDTDDDVKGRFGFDHEFTARVDNGTGTAKITGAAFEESRDKDEDQDASGFDSGDYVNFDPGAAVVKHLDVESPVFADSAFLDYLTGRFSFNLDGNPCGKGASQIVKECVQLDDCQVFAETADKKDREAWIKAIDDAMAAGIFRCTSTDDRRGPEDSDTLTLIGDVALIEAGYSNREGRQEIMAYLITYCDDIAPFPSILDGIGFFDVTCTKAGTYDINVADEKTADNVAQLEIVCRSAPSDKSVIAHYPGYVEISPSPGHVSHSLVLVTLWDEEGKLPGSDYEVDFVTSRCSIETSGVDTVDEIAAASELFSNYSTLTPQSAITLEASAPATAPVDDTPYQDTTRTLDVGTPPASRAAAILGCNAQDAPGAKPGLATVTALIQVQGAQDVMLSVQVLVVGPPALIAMTATPTTVKCGEKATIVVEVADELRQPVSDHTKVDVVTNMGGVLGGTGAVAGHAGPVVPVSSTVAETFDGKATFYLLTSDLHTGPYEVVAATGGTRSLTNDPGPFYSTAPIVAQATVTCTGPSETPPAMAGAGQTEAGPSTAPPAATAAPPTVFIRPPSTGDGGLLP